MREPPTSPADDGGEVDLASLVTAADRMAQRAEQLLAEFGRLGELRKSRGRGVVPGQKTLVQSVAGEHTALESRLQRLRSIALDNRDDDPETLAVLKEAGTALRCSNVPSIQATWDIVKRRRGLVRLACRFSRHPEFGACDVCDAAAGGLPGRGEPVPKCPSRAKQGKEDFAWVDAVVDGGSEWVRVMGIDERRLLLHMAQGGWDWGEEESEDEGGGEKGNDDYGDISVVASVRQLVEAARANRHDYRVPRVHVIFTRITEGRNREIDRLMGLLRGMGGETQLTVDSAGSEFLATPPPPPDEALWNLVVADELRGLTATVNLDCSVLVALASDVTHGHAEVQPWHRGDQASQIVAEREQGSTLVRLLYPVLRGRTLVCTAAAAVRFREIVATIATPAEAARASILLGEESSGESLSVAAEDGRLAFQALSEHPVDPDLRLPISIVDSDFLSSVPKAVEVGRLPAVALTVAAELSELNRAVFLYGWAAGTTTVTANAAVAKQLVRLVEERRTCDDEAGPAVWLHPANRALATKGRPEAK